MYRLLTISQKCYYVIMWLLCVLVKIYLFLVCVQHHEQVYSYVNTLESLLFTSDIDLHVLEVFQQFCALRS